MADNQKNINTKEAAEGLNQTDSSGKLLAMGQYMTQPKLKSYLESVLGNRSGIFIQNMVALVSSKNELSECDRNSLLSCGLIATSMGLSMNPNFGQCAPVPYDNNNKNITECQFQMMKDGFVQLAIRTGEYAIRPNATDIREGELKDYSQLSGKPTLEFIKDRKKRIDLPIIGYCSYFQLRSGTESPYFMFQEDINAHGIRYSKSYAKYLKKLDDWEKGGKKGQKPYSGSLWVTDFSVMALKTVMKLNIKHYGFISPDIEKAVGTDQGILNSRGELYYGDNPEDEPVIEYIAQEQQRQLLDKFGADIVKRALENMKIEALSKVVVSQLENFENICKELIPEPDYTGTPFENLK